MAVDMECPGVFVAECITGELKDVWFFLGDTVFFCLQRPSISRRLPRTVRSIANIINPLPMSQVAFDIRRRRGSVVENQMHIVDAHQKRSPGVTARIGRIFSRSLQSVPEIVMNEYSEPSVTHQPSPCGPKGVSVTWSMANATAGPIGTVVAREAMIQSAASAPHGRKPGRVASRRLRWIDRAESVLLQLRAREMFA